MSTIMEKVLQGKALTGETYQELKEISRDRNRPVHHMMMESGLIREDEFFGLAAKEFSGPVIDHEEEIVDASCTGLIPYKIAKQYGVFPVRREQKGLLLAMTNPHDLVALNDIGFLLEMPVNPALCTKSQMAAFIKQYYIKGKSIHELLQLIDSHPVISQGKVVHRETKVDIGEPDEKISDLSNFVNRILADAIDARSSDIHIEPQDETVNVRYRIDGKLKNIIFIPRHLMERLVARIKILAKLDIAEKRQFQDGRCSVWMEGRKIDLRVSVVPVYHGEKAVIRILDRQQAVYDMDKVGLSPQGKRKLFRETRRPQGVVLLTGPTGSGKTTTVYAALQDIKDETRNIVTVEDPVEYLVPGLNQIQLNRIKDVTFANCLRSILRQDPDILFVGEIRDRETAEVAFQASLTGHLVFSTLHTNSAVATIVRLMDIGLESYLIASAVNLIVSQRLLRVICPDCQVRYTPEKWLREQFSAHCRGRHNGKFVKGKGCARCHYTGYRGRTAIFELLSVNPAIRSLIYDRASEAMLLRQAVSEGMTTLVQSGMDKVIRGETTLEELASVTDILAPGSTYHGVREDVSIMNLMRSKYLSANGNKVLC